MLSILIEWKRSEGACDCHRRNHHTTMKNQNTNTRNKMYHSHRQPCRCAMLFIRRNVPARMPEVSANASFIWLSCTVESRTSFPMPIVISLSNLTLAARPSNASSFWPSKSSTYRWPEGSKFELLLLYGDERPEAGGVTPRRAERSRSAVFGDLNRWDM